MYEFTIMSVCTVAFFFLKGSLFNVPIDATVTSFLHRFLCNTWLVLHHFLELYIKSQVLINISHNERVKDVNYWMEFLINSERTLADVQLLLGATLLIQSSSLEVFFT